MQKYKHLDSCHFFTPVAIETTGVFGPRTTEFLNPLGAKGIFIYHSPMSMISGHTCKWMYNNNSILFLKMGAMSLG